ncbi:MAG: ABC transporter permease [bacterium]
MILENFRLAFKSLAANKLRTLLSMLGIIIGVGSVVAITSFGNSASQSIQANIAEAGLETITVAPGRGSAAEVDRLFREERVDDITELRGVRNAEPVNQRAFGIRTGSVTLTEQVVTATPALLEVFGLELAAGRFVSEEDQQERAPVVVLGSELATSLFGTDDAVGRYIRLLGDPARQLRVVGVLESKSDSFGFSFNTSAFVPRRTYLGRFVNTERVGRFVIHADASEDVIATSERIAAYFESRTGSADAVRVISPSTIAETFENVTDTLNIFLTGIAAISLLVGGIGIMNIMLVSVTERTKEIGIRKALGATPGRIMGQFLVEAGSLTAFGGAVGIAIGLSISVIVLNTLGWTFAPSPAGYALAFFVAAATGLFFGLYPAARASRLDPVIALSYE